jgi:hypothetical protein
MQILHLPSTPGKIVEFDRDQLDVEGARLESSEPNTSKEEMESS